MFKKINYNCSICFRINKINIDLYYNDLNYYDDLTYYDLIENERDSPYMILCFYSQLLSYTLIEIFIFILLDIKYLIIMHIVFILYFKYY